MRVAVKVPRDPGFAALRRAARAAIVIPDFGGLRRPRAIAYLVATVVGAVLVALGTLASSSPWLAAAVMLVVGFVISFSRVLGGYAAAANVGMLLAFVIAVTLPGSADVIPARVGGWVLAGLVSTLAAVSLWPGFERVVVHHLAAKALPAIADLVDGMQKQRGKGDLLQEIARLKVDAARSGYATMAKRPFGPGRRERAFAQLLVELDRIVEVVERPFNKHEPALRSGLVETDQLVNSVTSSLRSSAEVLTGGSPPDLDSIDSAREQHRVARDRWAAEQLRTGRPAEQVLDALDFEDTIRVVSYLAFSLSGNAITASGTTPDANDTAVDVLRTIRTHLESPSTVLQGSLRVAIGLALAVWVARSFGFSHGFWVVLGTIQVLRSNALGTGRTIILAVLGNVLGVAVGGLFAAVAGNHPTLMWIAFPIAVFGAAYAATTIGFMLSQAAFTINLIVVFNLISPAGWQVGLVRIEDLIVGALISLLVGLLLWPQGARRELARGLGSVYRSLDPYLAQAFDRVLGFEAVSPPDSIRQVVLRARDRAGETFETFTTERGVRPSEQEAAAFLLSSANHLILAGDLLGVIARVMGYSASGRGEGGREVREQVRRMLSKYRGLADRLSLSDVQEQEPDVSIEALREAELSCLRRWQTNPELGRGAMAVVMAGEWAQNLASLETDLEDAVSTAVDAARKPWWR